MSVLAEEIDTPGDGQVRALITVAGNPLVSTPNSGRLERAVDGLDFMLSIDIYVNETTRHADVILPAPEPLEKSHYDVAFYQLSARNIANFSPAVFEREAPAEWEIYMRLAGIVAGQGPNGDVGAFDDMVIQTLIQREVGSDGSRVAGRDPAELLAELEPRRGPERVLDFLLRTGPYGDGFGADPDGLTLDVLERSPHGDRPRAARAADARRCCARRPGRSSWRRRRSSATWTGCAPRSARERNGGLRADRPPPAPLEQLVDAQPARAREGQGALHAPHPPGRRRAARAGATAAARVVRSAPGSIEAPVEVTDEIMPGVVSIPHGWGHDADGVRMGVASAHAGVNSNVLADESQVEPLSGNAVLNGIPVEVERPRWAGAWSRRSCGRSRWRCLTSARSSSARRSAGTPSAARSGAGSTGSGSGPGGSCRAATARRTTGTPGLSEWSVHPLQTTEVSLRER